MPETYSVVLTGQCLHDEVLESVKNRVGKAFKLSPQQADKLFCGKPIALKRDLDKGQAVKLSTRLQELGAHTLIKAQALPVAKPVTKVEPVVKNSVAVSVPSQSPESAPAVVQQADNTIGDPPNSLTCPRCGHEQAVARACNACKMDFTLHLQRLERRAKLLANRAKQ